MSEQEEREQAEALHRVYSLLLGEEVWSRLFRFYQSQPEETLEITQELIAKRLGTL